MNRNLAYLALFTLPILFGLPVHAQEVPAAPADAFVESIGVCAHFGYGDTPYGSAYEGVRQKLLASGIRHVRDGILRPIEIERVEDLGKQGIHFCVVGEPEVETPEGIRERVKSINARVPGAIDAIEGPNEPDLFWVGNKKSYRGKSGANSDTEALEAAVLFHKDLYTAFKADPATKNIVVIGPSLGKTYEPGKNPLVGSGLSAFVDRGNFHPYFGGNPFSFPSRYATIEKYLWHGTHPGTNIDEAPYAIDTYAPPFAPKPMVATEAGCATDTNGTSESAHGKYIPRMFLEYFRKGIKRTYSYEFVDEFEDANNREARFGLLRRDLSPKPAYTALSNLIHLLSDKGKAFVPGKLDYTLTVSPVGEYTRTAYVHSLLLQKRDGAFYLCLWHEIANEDGSEKPRRQILPPPMPAVITVRTPVNATVTVYNWDENGEMTSSELPLTDSKLNVAVPDRVMVIKLTPSKKGE